MPGFVISDATDSLGGRWIERITDAERIGVDGPGSRLSSERSSSTVDDSGVFWRSCLPCYSCCCVPVEISTPVGLSYSEVGKGPLALPVLNQAFCDR